MDKELHTAVEMGNREHRFRMLCMSAVHRAMSEHGRIDPERADQEAHDVAMAATMLLLKQIYESDAELAALRIERDHYRDSALNFMKLSPPVPVRFTQEQAADSSLLGRASALGRL